MARRVMRIVAWSVGALFVLVFGGIVIGIATFDPETWKPRIVDAVKQATGRDIVLKGHIGLALSLRPTIKVEDIVLSNPPGFSRPEMATVQRVDLQLAVLSLLSRRIEIDRLIVTRPDVLFETSAQGQPNWVFTARQPPIPTTVAGAPAEGNKPAPLVIEVQDVRLDNGSFAYRDGKTGRLIVLAVKQFATKAVSANAPLHLAATFTHDGMDVDLTADTGPLSRLTDQTATGPFPVKLTLRAASAKITLEGTVAKPLVGQGLDLVLSADVPDLSILAPTAKRDLPPLRSMVLMARLSDGGKGPASGVAVRDLKLTSSAGDLAGDLILTPGTPPRLTGTLRAERIDADQLLRPHPASDSPPKTSGLPPVPATVAKSGKLFPDRPIPFGELQMLNTDLHLTIATLRLGGADYNAIDAHALLLDGVLKLDPAMADLPQGHVAVTLTVDAGQKVPPVRLTAHAPGIALQSLLSALGEPTYASGNLEVSADLHGAGESPHAIAASLDGSVGLAVAGGTIDVKRIGGAASGIIEKLNPKILVAGADTLRCFAVRLELNKGIGTFRALALSSGLVTMDGSGTVNLADETLALSVRSHALVGNTAFTMPMQVSGPIAAPRTRVDELGIARSNAGAFGGSIGSLLGRDKLLSGTEKLPGGGNADVCPSALALARGQAAPAPEADPPSSPSAPVPQPEPQPKLPIPGKLLQQLFR